jgi:acetyl esterase/lipase
MNSAHFRHRLALATVFFACLLAGFLSPGKAADEAKGFETKIIRNIAYVQGPDADPVRHRLDIYLPKDQKDFPVLFMVHGGGWIHGNKDHLGIYSALARTFTRHGIAVVCPNYRLSPKVQHPEHIRDVARAFAWTYKNVEKYGGRPDEIFVSGHSAGGHLCSLLATDKTYLKEHGLSLGSIKGAIPLSGLFTIPNERIFEIPFGKNRETHKNASPIHHVRADQPPFLIILGDNELPGCDGPQAKAFCKALKAKDVDAQVLIVPRRNHMSIIVNAVLDTDPVTRAMLSFIVAHITFDRLERNGPAGVEALGNFISRYAGN